MGLVSYDRWTPLAALLEANIYRSGYDRVQTTVTVSSRGRDLPSRGCNSWPEKKAVAPVQERAVWRQRRNKAMVSTLKSAMIEQLGKYSDWDSVQERGNPAASPLAR